MNKLSNRLARIASYIEQGDRVADVGTDHGYLPLYLFEAEISPHLILTDVNVMPLEKAQSNLVGVGDAFDFRRGNGLEPLQNGEVDTVVIAGLGGFTIIDILKKDLNKTRSFKRIIVQPRLASRELRKYLSKNGFSITSEALERERDKISEIFVVDNTCNDNLPDYDRDIDFEVSPLLFGREPLLEEWLQAKISTQVKVRENITQNSDGDNTLRLESIHRRIESLTQLLTEAKDGNTKNRT